MYLGTPSRAYVPRDGSIGATANVRRTEFVSARTRDGFLPVRRSSVRSIYTTTHSHTDAFAERQRQRAAQSPDLHQHHDGSISSPGGGAQGLKGKLSLVHDI